MVGDVLGPVLPVPAVTDLLDDLGVDGVSPLPDLREVEARPAPAWPRRGVSRSKPRDADDLQLVGLVLVQLDLVDHGVEALVVGAQRLQDLPDDLVLLVVASACSGAVSAGMPIGRMM